MPRNYVAFNEYRADAISAAKDLGYPQSIIIDILMCKTESEISSIMSKARETYL